MAAVDKLAKQARTQEPCHCGHARGWHKKYGECTFPGCDCRTYSWSFSSGRRGAPYADGHAATG